MSESWPRWERRDITDWRADLGEQQGSSKAVWLVDPVGARWLHKDIDITGRGEQDEDWLEVAATMVAQEFGVPCAQVQLVTRNGIRGSVSRSLRLDGYRFHDAYEWLVDSGVMTVADRRIDRRAPCQRPNYSLATIAKALVDVDAPRELEPVLDNGFDAFVGYLLLDALIGNQDRHDQNWAVLEPELGDATPHLAPSYDHASGLGFSLTENARDRCSRDAAALLKFAEGGRAVRFEHAKGHPQSLVDLAFDALAVSSEPARVHWIAAVRGLKLESIIEELRGAPVQEMSVASRMFAEQLLRVNQRRIQNACDKRFA